MSRTILDRLFESPEDSTQFAQDFAAILQSGDVVLLSGGIGAGKTHFARGVIQALLTVPEDVPSPTFTLVQTYETSIGPVWHADLYRLTNADEVRFINCYFSPTKNGVEFKSGARIYAEKCMFDHCSTAWRVNTADQYGEILPNQKTQLDSWSCLYRRSKQAFFLDGTASGLSTGDTFEGTRKAVTRNGATMHFR